MPQSCEISQCLVLLGFLSAALISQMYGLSCQVLPWMPEAAKIQGSGEILSLHS